MFSLFKKSSAVSLYSPLSGECVPVASIPDPVFAEKVLGDGVGITPTSGTVVAPADGTIIQVAHTFHALGIETADGLEILIHLGIDTVKLNGEGFTCHVKVGDKIKRGDKLMDVDWALLESKGYQTISPFIIVSMDKAASFTPHYGDMTAGETAAIDYKMK